MNIVCLDMEGVLVPEIWIEFSKKTGIPELTRTTRDEPDYDKLMHWRLGILREHGLGLKEIQDVIASIDPLPGAKEFLDELRKDMQVIIISDTFTQSGTTHVSHTPAACSFTGANARSWAGHGEARPAQSSLSAGALCYRAWAQSWSSAGVYAN